jgi:hypothetical protein
MTHLDIADTAQGQQAQPRPADVFISYDRGDARDLALRLFADLKRHHHRPWLDQSHIHSGVDWAREIEKAIDGCDALIALISTESFRSFYCRQEHARALRKDKPIVPVLVQPDADRPVYLEAAQYIDFTGSRDYEARFVELLSAVAEGRGVRAADLDDRLQGIVSASEPGLVGTRSAGAHSDWADVQRRATAQGNRFLRELRGQAAQPCTYLESCYVPRPAAEAELAEFVSGERQALIVVGDSGAGKSSVLCHWALARTDAGDAVLFYDCGGSLPLDIERELALDLELDAAANLGKELDRLDAVAGECDRRVILVFDGINEFQGDGGATPSDLLRRIDRLVGRLAGARIKIVLSCSTATWVQLGRNHKRDLFHSRYHQPAGEPTLVISRFDESEARNAYALYKEAFELRSEWAHLPPGLREKLHEPVFMRLFAETHQGRREPISSQSLTFGLLSEYVRSKVTPAQLTFLDELAAVMLDIRRSALSMNALRKTAIGTAMEAADGASNYQQLLDAGILAESQGDLFTPGTLRFTHTQVAAFLLARYLAQHDDAGPDTLARLAGQGEEFPLAWPVALMLLRATGTEAMYEQLASSSDPASRELAAEGLRELHVDEPQRVSSILARLMRSHLDEARHTALKAAYNIGPGARQLFIQAALDGPPPLRDTLKDVLYLIWRTGSHAAREDVAGTLYLVWRHDPDFAYDVLRELVTRIGWRDLLTGRSLTHFFIELSVMIYVNHCERREVIERTDELYYRLATERLPMAGLLLKARGRLFRGLIGTFAASFTRPILQWMGVDDAFFAEASPARAALGRIAAALDPASDLASHREDLALLLRADAVAFRGAAALAVAVHAYARFDAAEQVIRRLADDVDPRGRRWLLLGFGVLLPDTPHRWLGFVEELTARVLSELPDAFGGEPAADEDRQYEDLLFLPLGLACGKRDVTMTLLEQRIGDAIRQRRFAEAACDIRRLGPVGFYYPYTVYKVLAASLRSGGGLPDDPLLVDALMYCFARMRAVYLDVVDQMMQALGFDEALRFRVATTSDVRLVQRYVSIAGYYNNALHFSVHYPKMRRAFSAGALELLATAPSLKSFSADYTMTAVTMLGEAKFRLIEWTRAAGA